MRQINRSDIDVPPRLLQDLTAATGQVALGNDARNDIYAHKDVTDRLKFLYCAKCFLCERPVDIDGVVEHFLPWHKQYAARAYDWHNLHWSCDACNQRKKKHPYRVPSTGPAIRTDLIDPSAPPAGMPIHGLIEFDGLTMAARATPSSNSVVLNTQSFLNDPLPHIARLVQRNCLSDAIVQGGFCDAWREISTLDPIDIASFTETNKTDRLLALEKADALYDNFLCMRAPFSVSMGFAVYRITRVTVRDFCRMSDAYRIYKGLALIAR